MTKAKHPAKTIMTTTRPLELLHMDLFGPNHYSAVTNGASLYGFVIVDDYSRYTWVHIVTYKHEQNGVVERKNRTLAEMARTMLDEYKIPRHFWIEAIDTACRIINRVYLHKFFKKTAYELLTDKKPNRAPTFCVR